MSWFSWNCFKLAVSLIFLKEINIFVYHKFEFQPKNSIFKNLHFLVHPAHSLKASLNICSIFLVHEYFANNSTLLFLRYQEHYDNNCEACCEINFWSHHSWSFRRQIHPWIERWKQCQNQSWRTCKEVSWSRTTKMQIESNPVLYGNNCIFWNVQWGHCWQSKFIKIWLKKMKFENFSLF